MKLITGLGNPGAKYRDTRHNLGYWVVDELAGRWRVSVGQLKFSSLAGNGRHHDETVWLLKPQTYMNRSGDAVSAARDYFNLSLDDILLVSDDVDLPVGTIRMRASGSAGGHKGLEDCLKKLGGSAISRLRVGVGRSDGGADTADYVLSAPITEEKEELRSSARSAAKAAELWLKVGPELAMNEVNKEMWS